jgi:hypothetical protein
MSRIASYGQLIPAQHCTAVPVFISVHPAGKKHGIALGRGFKYFILGMVCMSSVSNNHLYSIGDGGSAHSGQNLLQLCCPLRGELWLAKGYKRT